MMARLIDADKLLTNAIAISNSKGQVAWSEVSTIDILTAPTVDAAPVVRCRDCKYRFKNNGHSRDGCPIIDANIWMDGDDFCSHGERKDGDGNG